MSDGKLGGGVQVFFSHASTDRWIAEKLSEEAGQAGSGSFLDVVDVEVGDNFDERILDGLKRCTELVVLLTPASIESRWVWLEIGVGVGTGKRVSVIVHGLSLEEVVADARMPIVVRRMQMIHLNDASEYFVQLRKRVEDEG